MNHFTFGLTSVHADRHYHRYDGSSIVSRSVKMGEPVIYVSMNYR